MPIKSSRPDVVIPEGSVYELLFGNLDPADENRIAIIDSATGSETTYGQLKAMINAFAGSADSPRSAAT